MSAGGRSIWILGLIPSQMALGLVEILFPLYAVAALHEGFFYIGILGMVDGLAFAPLSYISGRLCGRYGHLKLITLLPFVPISLLLYLVPAMSDPSLLLLNYAIIMAFLGLHRPAVNLLLAENYSYEDWGRWMTRSIVMKSLGLTLGLVIGTLYSSTLPYSTLFMFSSVLMLASSLILFASVQEPPIKLERILASVDRYISATTYAVEATRYTGQPLVVQSILSRISTIRYGRVMMGVLAFSFAGGLVFTPLPVLLKNTFQDSGAVFLAFLIFKIAMTATYFFSGNSSSHSLSAMRFATITRAAVVIALGFFLLQGNVTSMFAVLLLLAIMGVQWAMFDLVNNNISLVYSSSGGGGVYFAVLMAGDVVGSALSGLVITSFGGAILFAVGSISFLVAFLILARAGHE